jgi:hypothetical protein
VEPVTTVRFEQKVSLPNYESATISITVSNIPEDAPRNYIRGMVATGEVAIDVLREVVEAKINQIRKPLSPERAEELNTRINALTAPAVNPLLAPVENPLLASTPEPVPEPAPVPTPEASQPDPDDVIPSLDDEPQNFGKGLVTFGHPFGGYEFAPGEGTGLLSSEPNRMRQLNSLMARTGFTDYRHQLAGVVFGRRIASLNEITIREAEVLSDFLLHASDDQKKTALGAARK